MKACLRELKYKFHMQADRQKNLNTVLQASKRYRNLGTLLQTILRKLYNRPVTQEISFLLRRGVAVHVHQLYNSSSTGHRDGCTTALITHVDDPTGGGDGGCRWSAQLAGRPRSAA